jgi:DNA-binding Lrp family transcriptional regulator
VSEHIIDPQLKTYGSERQGQYVDAVNACGSQRRAAETLGVNESTLRRALERLKTAAAIRGYAPEHDYTRPVPEPHVAQGISTYYNADGKPTQQWVKSNLKAETYRKHVEEKLGDLIEDMPARRAPEAPTDYSTDVIPWIQLGDAHIGMLAHAAEVGEHFDLKIAKRELMGAIDHIVDEMPACERAVLNDLGDFTHYENYSATTEASGHALDYDSRFPKMIDVYVDTMLYLVDRLLTKVKVLDVIINQGNHSRTNDIWMAKLIRRPTPTRAA